MLSFSIPDSADPPSSFNQTWWYQNMHFSVVLLVLSVSYANLSAPNKLALGSSITKSTTQKCTLWYHQVWLIEEGGSAEWAKSLIIMGIGPNSKTRKFILKHCVYQNCDVLTLT